MGRMLSARFRPAPASLTTSPPVRAAAPEFTGTAPISLAPAAATDPQTSSAVRKIAFGFGLALIYVRFAVLPEFLFYFTGVNTYLLYLLAPPAVLGLLFTGGLRRTLRARASWCWIAFFGWMILATPFSSWRGGSIDRISSYGRIDFLFLFVMAGLAITWGEVRAIFGAIALAGVTNLLLARTFVGAVNGRMVLDLPFNGVITNSNDLAAHLIILLPFLLFVALKTRNLFLRGGLLVGMVYGLWVILGTASRGAFVGLLATFVFYLLRAPAAHRTVMLVASPVLAIVFVALMSPAALQRLGSVFKKPEEQLQLNQDDEAAASWESRNYLLKKSLYFTATHPLFGVGPSQFSNYEGKTSRAEGLHGNWHETHNSYTQVSSECGIPALFFFIAGLVSAFRLVNDTYRLAREAGNKEIALACLCYLLTMVGYLVTLIFLAHAYRFTLPALIGLGVAIHFAAEPVLRGKRPASA